MNYLHTRGSRKAPARPARKRPGGLTDVTYEAFAEGNLAPIPGGSPCLAHPPEEELRLKPRGAPHSSSLVCRPVLFPQPTRTPAWPAQAFCTQI